uniref:Thymidylate kinase n=1 Tax=candidate division WOR-3 bacterium TaxID=2052148 RepID=A0A7C4TIK8_UNCW3
MNRGLFITFEGVEGSGKTTQARLLAQWLEKEGLPFILVREPGGTLVSEKIREILLSTQNNIHPRCEVLLFLAARSQLVYEKILNAIREKKIVIADRFSDSTFAYQVFGRGLPKRLISIFNRFACAGLKPDLTFLVDIDVTQGRNRGKFLDRMETQNEMYHQKVREGYLKLAKRAKKRIKVLNGEKSVEELHREVVDYVKDLLKRKAYKIPTLNLPL